MSASRNSPHFWGQKQTKKPLMWHLTSHQKYLAIVSNLDKPILFGFSLQLSLYHQHAIFTDRHSHHDIKVTNAVVQAWWLLRFQSLVLLHVFVITLKTWPEAKLKGKLKTECQTKDERHRRITPYWHELSYLKCFWGSSRKEQTNTVTEKKTCSERVRKVFITFHPLYFLSSLTKRN